ncbi:MAG: glutaminyl-peptide cyclotransferase [Alphaproteobacteria bacterium]|nr:glutaminyl-peptide cyclotransferase [Alphaproteobacteria bacterium]
MRFLTGLVVGLAVLIVTAAGLLAWGLFSKSRGPGAASSPTVAILGLPEECAIKSVSASGDNIVVHVQSADGGHAPVCDRIVIVHAATGRVTGTIDARAAR